MRTANQMSSKEPEIDQQRRSNENFIGDATTNHEEGNTLGDKVRYLVFRSLFEPPSTHAGSGAKFVRARYYRVDHGHSKRCQRSWDCRSDRHNTSSGDECRTRSYNLRYWN